MKITRVSIYVPNESNVRYFEIGAEVRKAGEETATARVLNISVGTFQKRVSVKLSNGDTVSFVGFPFITS